MDSSLAAEEFPGLYRAILDGVAELERMGQRDEAHRVRRAATSAYSGPWGDSGHRRLTLLLARIDRALATPDARPERRRPGPRSGEGPRLGSLLRRPPIAR